MHKFTFTQVTGSLAVASSIAFLGAAQVTVWHAATSVGAIVKGGGPQPGPSVQASPVHRIGSSPETTRTVVIASAAFQPSKHIMG
jgi:hypothetical protein